MTPLLDFFCFVMIAIGALWRVVAWVHPFNPAGGAAWFSLLADPIPPILSMYVPDLVGTLGSLLILFFLLKRSLAFMRAGAFEVPGSFTRIPAALAAVGFASSVAVFGLTVTPGTWAWKSATAIWLINLALLVLPVSFYVTEIGGLVRSMASPPRAPASSIRTVRGIGPPSVVSRPAAPSKWSWLAYGVIWVGVSAWIVHHFGGLELSDSTQPPSERLVAFGVAAIPGGLVVALVKIFADPILIGIAAKRSKVDMAEELLDSVALTAVGVAGEAALDAAAGAASDAGSGGEGGGFSGGGGSSGGGGASGTV